MKRLLVALSLLLGSACATTPEAPPAPPPELVSQDLHVQQDLTSFQLTFKGEGKAEQPATVARATWEMVVDGEVVKSGETPLNVALAGGEAVPLSFEVKEKYVDNAEQLRAYDQAGGSVLAALRGQLHVEQGGQTHAIEFARSREVRRPRLPSVRMQELDAARYSSEEANIIFRLGIVNPNPFPLHVQELTYKIEVAGKQIGDGVRASGESVDPSSTGMFEVQIPVSKATYGDDIKKLIATANLPWVVSGELKGDLYAVPYSLNGSVKLYGSSK